MKKERSMEQAIQEEARDLWERDIPEERAVELYREKDLNYRRTVNHKTRRGAAEIYIQREACALYLKERYEVDLK